MNMTRAELRENMLVAFDTLRAHKVRSALTILGIVIGVTSVISVASIIQGLNRYVQEKVESLGSRTYFITRFPPGTMSFDRLPEKVRQRKFLEYSDARAIAVYAPAVSFVTVFGTRMAIPGMAGSGANDVMYEGARVEKLILRGVEPEYAQAFPMFTVGQGRFISRADDAHARPVVVLGAAIADSLFGPVDGIGRQVRLNGKLYEVIGILQREAGMFGGPGPDDFALIPMGDFRKRYPEAKELVLAFTVPADESIVTAQDQVSQALRRIRKVPPAAENDFELTSPDFLSSMWNQLTGALAILTFIISSVGLLVGGIGVMNIMLISVTERTAEIGVRKAIGARRSDIRAQFLIEAITMCAAGGAIGIAMGMGIAMLVRMLLPSVPATVSWLWAGLGVAMSVGVGLFFGYYPANRAANLDPIVCLRYE
ncbi:MAG: Macrolide export ATP-binding/permease protein MacB [Bryobacteraceae bacterium]|nr:Macrolide export ATP-binding/permease protein MacB [Bryobacteraceae bacterium]